MPWFRPRGMSAVAVQSTVDEGSVIHLIKLNEELHENIAREEGRLKQRVCHLCRV